MTDRRTPRENGEPRTRERGRRAPATDAADPNAAAEADASAAAEKARLEEEAAAAEKARLDAEAAAAEKTRQDEAAAADKARREAEEAAAAEQARRDEEARAAADKARREAEEAAAAEKARHEQEAAAAAERIRIAREEADAAVERVRREQEMAAAAEQARREEAVRTEAERARREAEAAAAEKARLAGEQAAAEKARQSAKQTEEEAAAENARKQAEAEDDPEPDDNIVKAKVQRALADATKPIEAATEAIWSTDPDKAKARKAIEDAYRTAARRGTTDETAGELWLRYKKAEEKFESAAADMLRSRVEHWRVGKDPKVEDANLRESHLWRWIDTFLDPDLDPDTPAPVGSEKLQVRKILRERKQVQARLIETLGKREKARQDAAENTKNWEKAFGRWSAPDKEIAALIASYFDRIDQLNADINTGNNRDQAIFSFWFEVAPVHLQLRDKTVDATNTPGVELITKALQQFRTDPKTDSGLENNYKSGEDRKDGSLYLKDPGPKDPPQDSSPLAKKRQEVLNEWQNAAERQATAEAAYATRPDAAADLKPRHDKLKDDGWVKGTKESLVDPKKP